MYIRTKPAAEGPCSTVQLTIAYGNLVLFAVQEEAVGQLVGLTIGSPLEQIDQSARALTSFRECTLHVYGLELGADAESDGQARRPSDRRLGVLRSVTIPNSAIYQGAYQEAARTGQEPRIHFHFLLTAGRLGSPAARDDAG